MVDYEQQSWKQKQHTLCILLTSPYGNQTPPNPPPHPLKHLQTPWKIQMQIPKWKQQKKELGHAPSLVTLWG